LPERIKGIFLLVFPAVFVVMLMMQAAPALADTPAAVIDPAGGTYASAQSVTISNIPSGDVAYYTIDGTNPQISGTLIYYSGAFTVSQSETVNAAIRSSSGWGSVTSATFDISSSSGSGAPAISPSSGAYTSSQAVTISNISGTAYYTTDGSSPETSSTRIAYTAPFTVSQSETVEAVNDTSTGWSSVTSATFDINSNSGSGAPAISPSSGAYTSSQAVTISNISGTAYYTIEGSSPETSSTRITYTGTFTVSQSETVEAVNDTSTGWSSVTSATFTIGSGSSGVTLLSEPTAETGNAASIAGNYATLNGDITSNGGDIINGYGFYYSTDQNQWSEVTAGTDNHYGSFSYNLTGLTINTNYYFKAYATNPEGTAYGSVVSFITSAQSTQTTQSTGGPAIDPAGGTYTSAQTVTISNIPSGDTAYYTTDGSNPETSSTAVTYSAAFTVSQSETVQAAVHDPTSGWSSVTVASFTISSQSPAQSGSSSDQIDQLQQEFATALSYNQIDQATQILKQIQHLEKAQDTIANLEEQFTDAYSDSNWGSAETILKTIISMENPDWAYSQLGQIYQQQGVSNISVFVNGNEVNFDVQPVIVNDRVLVPIRQIANALGLSDNDVTWNADGSVAINDGSNQILITDNDQQVSLNGNPYSLDTPAQIIDGRMMVPLRAISQLLNKNVQWYPTGQIVEIS
jgi:hypothetical protein